MTCIRLTAKSGLIRDLTFNVEMPIGKIIDLFNRGTEFEPNHDAPSLVAELGTHPVGKALLEAVGDAPAPADDVPFEVHPKPKGGRPLGSKNKPKEPAPAAPTPAAPATPAAIPGPVVEGFERTSAGIATASDAQILEEGLAWKNAKDEKAKKVAVDYLKLYGYTLKAGA